MEVSKADDVTLSHTTSCDVISLSVVFHSNTLALSYHLIVSWVGLSSLTPPLFDLIPGDAQETTEFLIHSLDGKVWSFDAGSGDDMADWVKAIEKQIKKILEECILPNRGNVSWPVF